MCHLLCLYARPHSDCCNRVEHKVELNATQMLKIALVMPQAEAEVDLWWRSSNHSLEIVLNMLLAGEGTQRQNYRSKTSRERCKRGHVDDHNADSFSWLVCAWSLSWWVFWKAKLQTVHGGKTPFCCCQDVYRLFLRVSRYCTIPWQHTKHSRCETHVILRASDISQCIWSAQLKHAGDPAYQLHVL